MNVLNSDVVIEETVLEITLEDLYTMVMEISEDISTLRGQIVVLRDEVFELQELISQKLDILQETFLKMPEYDQLQVIIAFLFMLVCFELMKLVKGWTNSFRLKGGK